VEAALRKNRRLPRAETKLTTDCPDNTDPEARRIACRIVGRLDQTPPEDPSVRSTWSVVLTFLHFPHNLALLSVLYISERPEMSSHGEKSKKAKTRKGN